MTNEEVELLIKDIGGRLSYGVKFHYFPEFSDEVEFDNTISVLDAADWQILDEDHKDPIRIRQIMPYLRPLSSMTEQEIKELQNIVGPILYDVDKNLVLAFECNDFRQLDLLEDWLNEHMFDYRGLIKKGLVAEAPEGMYKTE